MDKARPWGPPGGDANSYDFVLKIVMCGDSGVGKSNLLARFTKNEFVEDTKSTIGAEFATTIAEVIKQVNGEKRAIRIKLQVWDTAGQERYRAITRTYYRQAYGCVLVYAVNSRKSFKHCDKWLQEIRSNCTVTPVISMAGNKADLPEKSHKVEKKEALEYALASKCDVFYETSAKTGQGVHHVFSDLASRILDAHPNLLIENPEYDPKAAKGVAAAAAPDKKKTILVGPNVHGEDPRDGCCH